MAINKIWRLAEEGRPTILMGDRGHVPIGETMGESIMQASRTVIQKSEVRVSRASLAVVLAFSIRLRPLGRFEEIQGDEMGRLSHWYI